MRLVAADLETMQRVTETLTQLKRDGATVSQARIRLASGPEFAVSYSIETDEFVMTVTT